MPNRVFRFNLIAVLCGCLCVSSLNAGEAQAPPASAPAAAPVEKDAKAPASKDTPEKTGPIDPFAEANKIPDNDPNGTVRLIGVTTDVGKRFTFLAPPLPFPPFSGYRKWMMDHQVAVHCSLEWKDEKGKWFNAELRSSKWDGTTEHRVGCGQFPCSGYIAYGIFIMPGRYPRSIDKLGRPIEVTLDEVIKCDYKKLEAEIRKYGTFNKHPGDPGTGGYGKENVGLGGPAYKPAQNSNTMINYCLKKCGVQHCAPDLTAGWDVEPTFPYSTNTRYPSYND